jgi:glycosyltransferase involved in cell wall biosynthesis
MLTWEYPPRIVGGISRVVYDLAQKLGENESEVHVVTCWEPGSKEIEKDRNVYVHRVHTSEIGANNFVDWVLQLNFSLIEYSTKLLNQIGSFDLIHAHDWLVAFAAKTLKHAYTIPLVATMHATEYGRNSGIHNDIQMYINSIEWMLCYESWKIIVNSEYMKNEVSTIFQLPSEKVWVIPNGVDLEKFDGFERDLNFRRNYASDSEKIVFFVGRLVHEKGVHVLVDAIPKVLKNYNNVKFVISGKGPQLEYLRGRAMALNVIDRIYFTGYIADKDLLRLYKCSDIAVFPSLYEPFGIVALEGMVADVPVVVSDTGGLGEIVNHGVDGMKAYTGNSNSLADCILEILFNPLKAEEMRKHALKKVNDIYNWKVISQKTKALYEQVLDEKSKSDWAPLKIKEALGLE